MKKIRNFYYYDDKEDKRYFIEKIGYFVSKYTFNLYEKIIYNKMLIFIGNGGTPLGSLLASKDFYI